MLWAASTAKTQSAYGWLESEFEVDDEDDVAAAGAAEVPEAAAPDG